MRFASLTEFVPAECIARKAADGYWYIDRRSFSFYRDGQEVARVNTSAIRRVLAAIDRQLARKKKKP